MKVASVFFDDLSTVKKCLYVTFRVFWDTFRVTQEV